MVSGKTGWNCPKSWPKLRAKKIAEVRETCREIPGWRDYWIAPDGSALYYLRTRNISAKNKEIVSHKLRKCIDRVNGYWVTKLIRYHELASCGPDHPTPCTSFYQHSRVHVLVALAWIGPPEDPTLFALHADGVKGNNDYRNLYWGTAKDNGADYRWHRKVERGTPESVRPAVRLRLKTIVSDPSIEGANAPDPIFNTVPRSRVPDSLISCVFYASA